MQEVLRHAANCTCMHSKTARTHKLAHTRQAEQALWFSHPRSTCICNVAQISQQNVFSALLHLHDCLGKYTRRRSMLGKGRKRRTERLLARELQCICIRLDAAWQL
eukprot:6181484-Pleurochrysis_carterae.AAC.7